MGDRRQAVERRALRIPGAPCAESAFVAGRQFVSSLPGTTRLDFTTPWVERHPALKPRGPD
ncbi:hypothetical protein C5O80_33165 [Burkholderia sp. SRS-46]|nr:hypothetical protein C5O80_33165 [Burkholderia sp. SRS-46]